jgi:hypothetical protein
MRLVAFEHDEPVGVLDARDGRLSGLSFSAAWNIFSPVAASAP